MSIHGRFDHKGKHPHGLAGRLEKVIGSVGVKERVRIVAFGQHENARVEQPLLKDNHTALRCFYAGLVGIVNQDGPSALPDKPLQNAHVIGRQRRAEGGHRVGDGKLVHGQQIKIALDHVHGLGGAALPARPVQPVKGSAFMVYRRLGTVEVFGQRVVHHPAAEPDRLVLDVENGEHDPVAESVVVTVALFAGHD